MTPPTAPTTSSCVARGIVLGMVNMVAIAVVLAREISPHYVGDAAASIFVAGLLFAMPAGAFVGWVASRLDDHRLAMLIMISVTLVPLCGSFGVALFVDRPVTPGFQDLVALASFPTAACSALLERWTRRPPAPPP